jgi:hypothetical protein
MKINLSMHYIIATIKLCIGGLYFFHYVFYKLNGDATPLKNCEENITVHSRSLFVNNWFPPLSPSL